MTSTLLRNLGPKPLTTHLLTFIPKPVLIEMHLMREGSDAYWVGSARASAARYLVEPKVPGVKGVLAMLIGKQPSSVRFWMTEGPAPTFVRFEGPLYVNGPTWRIELAAPRWRR